MTREWRKLDTPANPESRLSNEDQTRSNTEIIPVCRMGMRNQLGVLVESPSLSWLKTNKNHIQKDVKNLEWA